MITNNSYQERIVNHYELIFKNKAQMYLYDKGPIQKLPFNFRILEFPPHVNRNMWTYATCCMSQVEDKHPIELHIFSSVRDEGLIELLTAATYYHRNTNKLGLNHTINFGRSWQNISKCTFGYISLPYLDGPSLETLMLDNNQIKFYWLIPVTEDEVKYKTKFGPEALEATFEEKGFDYINPERPGVV